MSNSALGACGACGKGLCGGKAGATLRDGLFTGNPVWVQVLGICSVLAVTNKLANALVMGVALTFVLVFSNLFVSLLRNTIPHRIRMIVEVVIIATFVIIFDQVLKAFYWDMSRQLGPYVGLIITNCIVMGRAEAFALQNPPMVSLVDAAANGVGYAGVLAVIGAFRELIGSGTVLGYTVLSPEWYLPNQLLILAPGAFFALGGLIAVVQAVRIARAGKAEKAQPAAAPRPEQRPQEVTA